MSKKYAALLSPVRIGNTVLKNRMVFPNASPSFLQGPEDFPAEGFLAFNSALARNGAAIVTPGGVGSSPSPADAGHGLRTHAVFRHPKRRGWRIT